MSKEEMIEKIGILLKNKSEKELEELLFKLSLPNDIFTQPGLTTEQMIIRQEVGFNNGGQVHGNPYLNHIDLRNPQC